MGSDVSKPEETRGKKWFLLVAGSNDWKNYSHQANVCRAYQLVHQKGIPDEQIVVMMYDDIANNKENPKPGQIINVPNGPDVYKGVPKDYTGNDVSAENFLAVLRGDSAAVHQTKGSKKVIKSGNNDNVFIYLTAHGGSGVFKFFNSTLHADDLRETLSKMSMESKFAKMVIYISACHSGSMLNEINVKNVYGVTSCSPDEVSYACFHDKTLKACMSDDFSACWLSHTETADLNQTSFRDQFNFLWRNFFLSHFLLRKHQMPCSYGDTNISQLKLSEFLG